MQKQKKMYFQQKRNTISRNFRGKVGENWAPIVQQKQRGNWPRGVWEASVPAGGVSE